MSDAAPEDRGRKSHEKGHSFEQVFADYMRVGLGYSETLLCQQLRGRTSVRPYEVDILGVKKKPFWKMVYVAALLVIFAGALTLWAPSACAPVTNTMTAAGKRVQKASGLTSAGAGIVAIGVIAFLAGAIGDRSSRHRVWVECKDRKSRIKHADLAKTLSAVEDVRAAAGSSRARAIDAVWFASTVEYDVDAVGLAREKGVSLYLADGDDFKLIY